MSTDLFPLTNNVETSRLKWLIAHSEMTVVLSYAAGVERGIQDSEKVSHRNVNEALQSEVFNEYHASLT